MTLLSHGAPASHRTARSRRSARSPRATPSPHRHRLALASGSRADLTAQCAAQRHPIRRRPQPTFPPSAHHTRTHTATIARRAAAQRAPQPAATSHLLPARAPTATHAHHARRTLCAVRFTRRLNRNITRRLLITRARAQPQRLASRDAAGSQPTAPHTRFRLARQSCRTLHSTLRTQNFVRHASHAALFAPPAHHTRTHTPDAPTRRDAANPSARRQSHSLTSRVPTTPHSAQHTAMRNTPRTQPGAPFALTHEPPQAPRGARYSKLSAHRRLALASGSRADRTAQRAPHHARSSLRAVCSSHARTHNHVQHATHATQYTPSAHIQCARQAPAPQRSPSAEGRGSRDQFPSWGILPLRQATTCRTAAPIEAAAATRNAAGMPAARLPTSPGTSPHRPVARWRCTSDPVFARARSAPESPNSAPRCPSLPGGHCGGRCVTTTRPRQPHANAAAMTAARLAPHRCRFTGDQPVIGLCSGNVAFCHGIQHLRLAKPGESHATSPSLPEEPHQNELCDSDSGEAACSGTPQRPPPRTQPPRAATHERTDPRRTLLHAHRAFHPRRTRPIARHPQPRCPFQHSPRTRPAHAAPPQRRTQRRTHHQRRRSPPANSATQPISLGPARACGLFDTNISARTGASRLATHARAQHQNARRRHRALRPTRAPPRSHAPHSCHSITARASSTTHGRTYAARTTQHASPGPRRRARGSAHNTKQHSQRGPRGRSGLPSNGMRCQSHARCCTTDNDVGDSPQANDERAAHAERQAARTAAPRTRRRGPLRRRSRASAYPPSSTRQLRKRTPRRRHRALRPTPASPRSHASHERSLPLGSRCRSALAAARRSLPLGALGRSALSAVRRCARCARRSLRSALAALGARCARCSLRSALAALARRSLRSLGTRCARSALAKSLGARCARSTLAALARGSLPLGARCRSQRFHEWSTRKLAADGGAFDISYLRPRFVQTHRRRVAPRTERFALGPPGLFPPLSCLVPSPPAMRDRA